MTDDTLRSLAGSYDISDEDLRTDSDDSSRTTFKLSEDAVDALSWLADYYGSTQKKIIGHVLHVIEEMEQDGTSLVEAVHDVSPAETVRKAVAIDPEVRQGLNDASDRLDVSRDDLVEVGIRLTKLFAKKRSKKQKEMLQEIQEYYHRGLKLEDRLSDELGRSDELYRGFGRAMLILEDLLSAAEDALENDKPIELPF